MTAVGTFTIKFHEHIPWGKILPFLEAFQTAGARIEEQSPYQFLIICETESQIEIIGRSVLRTHLKSLFTIASTSGLAPAKANTFPLSITRSKRKRGH